MTTILAIETSTETATVALLHGGELAVRRADGTQTHSQSLLPAVGQLLADAGLGLKQCDAVAFGAGPGSFTGVRTACGAAQGLAFGAGLPVVPIVTLLAMAQRCHRQTGAQDVLAVLDARMGEVYWAQYRHDGEWRIVAAPALSAAAGVAAAGRPHICGNGLALLPSAPDVWSGMHAGIMPGAADVAALAQIEVARGRLLDPRDAQPLYLRNKVALTTAERAAREAA